MTGSEIRKRFLDYFAERGHQVVSSSSLVPHDDPTLLFTNAGMNQFKDCFLGKEKRSYVRAASSQKCVRAGGKHNDLENVGRTARHHTFFEMLGNFSFGDYFKKEAIAFAWEFLTEDLNLDKDRLYVTVYTDDDEAADIWHEQEGVPRERIFRFEEDNFWAMGDTGPCGPCSEIFWDNGPEMACDNPDCNVGCECDRYMEIWNNVFMQFERSQDGTLTPLPKPAVDTGMGLERITTVMQRVKSNYATDLLRSIISHIEKLAGKTYGADEEDDVSMQVMADHSRAMAYLIADGVMPSNEGRGYVLRRIMRRAMRHARMIGFEDPILFNTASFVLDSMSEAYPEEAQRKDFVAKVVQNEEERFMLTLDKGLRILQEEVEGLKAAGKTMIPGPVLFKLYDTFGFPTDLTADIIEKDGLTVDEEGFNACMDEQRRKAREHWKGSGEEAVSGLYFKLNEAGVRTDFTGYQGIDGSGEILALIKDGEQVEQAVEGEKVEIIVSSSPFYGESGGQVGDCGEIVAGDNRAAIIDTKRPLPDLIVHSAKVAKGTLQVGLAVNLKVDSGYRNATELNHTATHILQAVLIDVLGDHVKQAGSLVTPERLRFDFTHFSQVTTEEILEIEEKVNRFVRANNSVKTNEMEHEEAVAAGATALFGEKYGDRVRVVGIGDFSMELCGGTHVDAAGDIGLFRILSEGGIAAGVRRIEAVTGAKALELVQDQQQTLDRLATIVKSDRSQLEGRLTKMLDRQKELEREVEKLKSEINKGKSGDLLANVIDVKGVKLLAAEIDGLGGKELREFSDKMRDSLGSGVMVLASSADGKVNLLVAVTKDLTDRVKAGAIIAPLAEMVGGKGGGRPDLAQAGGKNPAGLPEMLEQAKEVLAGMI